MSFCGLTKLPRYLNAARSEGVEFGLLDVNNLSINFGAVKGNVTPGLIGLKGVGKSRAELFLSKSGNQPITDIDDYAKIIGRDKVMFERLIKLGAFKEVPGHNNSQGLWYWYKFKYCAGKDITKLRNEIKEAIWVREGYTTGVIAKERSRLVEEFKKLYPKRAKIPTKISEWVPTVDITRDKVIELYDDYNLEERLQFQKQYLGYHVESPLDLYKVDATRTIKESRADGKMEVLVLEANEAKTKKGDPMMRLKVADRSKQAIVYMWSNNIDDNLEVLSQGIEGKAIFIPVKYDLVRKNFTIEYGGKIRLLEKKYEA